jgi:DNA-binding response OmpR family regulator
MEQGGGVIVVDDEGLIAHYIKTILEGGGGRCGRNSGAGPSDCGSNAAGLAVVDIGLPDVDGIELARRLREERNIGIIFSTGFGDTETRQRMQTIESAVRSKAPAPRRADSPRPRSASAHRLP